jgi:hypothetical protein
MVEGDYCVLDFRDHDGALSVDKDRGSFRELREVARMWEETGNKGGERRG